MRLQPKSGGLCLLMLLGACSPALQAGEEQSGSSDDEFAGLMEFLGEFSSEDEGWIDPFELEAMAKQTNTEVLQGDSDSENSASDILRKEPDTTAERNKERSNTELVNASRNAKQ